MKTTGNAILLFALVTHAKSIMRDNCDENKYVPTDHETCCNMYYVCHKSKLWVKQCRAKYVFNPLLGDCDSIANYACATEICTSDHPPCPPVDGKVDVYYEDTLCDNKFFHCSHGTPFRKVCPASLVWNQDYKVCDWKKEDSFPIMCLP